MNYLAIDLGAESGRIILVSLENRQITLEEIHRFPNVPIREGTSIRWNLAELLRGVEEGVFKVAQRGAPVASISADSWGVDYVISPEEPVFHYRDPRTERGAREFLAKVPWEAIFAETGIQYMPINTLFQLAAEPSERLRKAARILSIADFVNMFVGGGVRGCIEESMASTFQLYNPRTRDWSPRLLNALGLSRSILGDVVRSGTILGTISKVDARFPGREIKIIATCSHDTGCAVAAVPAEPNTNWAYLSSGTWSLMGVERAEPIINDLARELNFTNEIGYGGSIRLLKNISGLWLLQECRRVWGQFDYAELTRLAEGEPAFRSIINPANPRFLAPANMPMEIASFCRETNQPVPETPAAFTRCIYESLALLYRRTLRQIEKLTGQEIEVLHIVGGGSRNALLNQFTADACEVEVLAGPVEATAIGNIMIQAITLGEVADLPAARALIRQNFEMRPFVPRDSSKWLEAYGRFEKLAEVL